jgi:hypothetical protein
VEAYRVGGILVIDSEEVALNADFYAKLFLDFALQGNFKRFAASTF